jgi:glutaredoxin-related protein
MLPVMEIQKPLVSVQNSVCRVKNFTHWNSTPSTYLRSVKLGGADSVSEGTEFVLRPLQHAVIEDYKLSCIFVWFRISE